MAAMTRSGEEAGAAPLPLERWISYRFGLVAARMGSISTRNFVEPHGLTTSSWRALAVIARYEPLSATTLSEHTRLDPPKISRAIEALVAARLLSRTRDPADQRRAVLRLTARGRKTYAQIGAEVTAFEAETIAALSEKERDGLWAALEKIDTAIAAHRHAR